MSKNIVSIGSALGRRLVMSGTKVIVKRGMNGVPVAFFAGVLSVFGLGQVNASEPSKAGSGSRVLEEIIVTATKRAVNLQDVPMSISVVTGKTVDDYRIEDMRDLQSFVPNFTVQNTFVNASVRVRGLGSGVMNMSFDSSVGIFNDGIYCGRSRCLEAAFLDVDRIEVARGPQGALFGKSTIAGALSVVSARPTEAFESYLQAGYEAENDGYVVTGMVSGPFSDVLRGRLVSQFEEKGGYMDNPYLNRDDPESDKYAIRGLLDWDVTENVLVGLKVEHFTKELNGRTTQLVSPGLFGALTTDPDAEFKKNKTRRVSTGTVDEEFDDSDSMSVTLTVDVALGEHTLTAIAGYWEFDYENWIDVDGVSDNFITTSYNEDYDQTSLELRLLSPVGQTFEYILGGLYHTSDMQYRQYTPFGFPPAFFATVPVGIDRNYQRDADTKSVYGQITWNATDRFRIIADLRWTREEQKVTYTSCPAKFPDKRFPVCVAPAEVVFPAFQSLEFLFFQNRTDESVDPSLRFQYELSDDVMLYAVYATGSKPGGMKSNDGTLAAQLLEMSEDSAYAQRFVGQSSITAEEIAAGVTLKQGNGVLDFEDEEAENYEIGAKMTFAGGAATLNLALFHMDFHNLQTSSWDGTRFIIKNAASAEIEGIELEGTWQASANLRLSGSVGYLDHEFKKFLGAQCVVVDKNGTLRDPNCQDGQEDLSGEKLNRTPDWEASLSADWEGEIANNMLLQIGVSMYHSDDYSVRQDFHPLGVQDSYTKWDVRVGLSAVDDRWDVAIIGRNLTDELILQHAFEVVGSNFVSFSTGRTVTLQGTVRF